MNQQPALCNDLTRYTTNNSDFRAQILGTRYAAEMRQVADQLPASSLDPRCRIPDRLPQVMQHVCRRQLRCRVKRSVHVVMHPLLGAPPRQRLPDAAGHAVRLAHLRVDGANAILLWDCAVECLSLQHDEC